MKQIWSNSTVWWSEEEIVRRECVTAEIVSMIQSAWTTVNHAVRFARVETPVLTPLSAVSGHVSSGFNLMGTDRDDVCLRPETTAGCIAAFESMLPMTDQRRKRMPMCVWQVGKSYRTEANADTMRATKLRLSEFWQLEFELFAGHGTKADYIGSAASVLTSRFGGEVVVASELPHYSEYTADWMMGSLEVAGMSIRTDWPEGKIFEVSIGLDRLIAMLDPSRKERGE